MVPIRLNWRRFPEGEQAQFGDVVDLLQALKENRLDLVTYELNDLAGSAASPDSPIVMHLMNARDDVALDAFQKRFGPLTDPLVEGGNNSWLTMNEARERFDLYLRIAPPRPNRIGLVNDLLASVSLRPQVYFPDGAQTPQIVLTAESLYDFMLMEIATIHQVGAVVTACSHCRKLYLTGPLTGRRSHAVYCSDRCRVAAMRARNAEKG
ncbi:hypothetical protein [Mesorhizobium sp. M7A.F.Ca.US.010.02.1.1]|uniref:hypothetical protein n=1 Tax=Mesorhizobium sp. M7A.F.Ca.US.010.02.1.1 TaxID=2496743 RepID=UPI000FD5B6E3|nr:hypothetical protein [Mesorhizobium sp. M7A.F.Ca.US.010.02.1.1]RUW92045.1 hypothetical protein EOA19_11740 [Mesorhizobium sp. M7A.F.Ca.US.010.02.1.1]